MSNVIDCKWMDIDNKRLAERLMKELGVHKALDLMIMKTPEKEIYIRALVNNILKRWKRGLSDY